MMSIQKRVLSFIKEERLWSSSQRVCIAVSGGVDSIVLMHLLQRTQRAHGGILMVCTIDHQFRPGSKEECMHVEEEAIKIGLPVQRKELNIPLGGNLYERARIARKAALSSLGCDVVATVITKQIKLRHCCIVFFVVQD
jgi:tRNA(Ile)-lysidine synthase TilS/MesJ